MTEFPYIALPSPLGKVYKPLIKIQLNYTKTHRVTPPITALIDSGADVCFCSDMIGAWLGIQLQEIKKVEEFNTANRGTFKAKPASVKLYVGEKSYETKVFFTNVLPHYTPIILGQIVFFDKFKVMFDSKKGVIQLD